MIRLRVFAGESEKPIKAWRFEDLSYRTIREITDFIRHDIETNSVRIQLTQNSHGRDYEFTVEKDSGFSGIDRTILDHYNNFVGSPDIVQQRINKGAID